jgi:hypothetical protein
LSVKALPAALSYLGVDLGGKNGFVTILDRIIALNNSDLTTAASLHL